MKPCHVFLVGAVYDRARCLNLWTVRGHGPRQQGFRKTTSFLSNSPKNWWIILGNWTAPMMRHDLIPETAIK
jgi:hypothetical protein